MVFCAVNGTRVAEREKRTGWCCGNCYPGERERSMGFDGIVVNRS
jgi:hypothetical protein